MMQRFINHANVNLQKHCVNAKDRLRKLFVSDVVGNASKATFMEILFESFYFSIHCLILIPIQHIYISNIPKNNVLIKTSLTLLHTLQSQ